MIKGATAAPVLRPTAIALRDGLCLPLRETGLHRSLRDHSLLHRMRHKMRHDRFTG
jgi:hypothetical protein